eukprot:2266080-Prymnesium_polylepis.3
MRGDGNDTIGGDDAADPRKPEDMHPIERERKGQLTRNMRSPVGVPLVNATTDQHGESPPA